MSLVMLPLLALALPQGSSAFVRREMPSMDIAMTFFVDEEGVVLDCEVDYPEVSEERAERYCERTIGEDAGEPAIGPDDEPVPGTLSLVRVRRGSGFFAWMEEASEPDFQIQVPDLPDDQERIFVNVLAYFDESGVMQACQFVPVFDPELSRIACETASDYVFDIRYDAAGEPVGYVNTVSTVFTSS